MTEHADTTTSNSTNRNSCPNCGSADISNSTSGIGELCGNCGTVLSEYQTKPIDLDLQNSTLTSPHRETWSDYYTVRNSTEQQIANALEILEELGDQLGIEEKIRRNAATLYGEAATQNLIDGRSAEAIIAAATILSARDFETAIPLGRVATAANVSEPEVYRSVRLLSQELGKAQTGGDPVNFLPFLCSELPLDERVDSKARTIISALKRHNAIGGKNPVGIASAAVYLAADGRVTQKDIANTAGVTTETIRVRVSDCREALSSA